jgi:hypothetical protein
MAGTMKVQGEAQKHEPPPEWAAAGVKDYVKYG